MLSSTPTFDRLFSKAPAIQFNPNWVDHTGDYNHAIKGEHAPLLEYGEVRTCVSPVTNQRLVIIGTKQTEDVYENIILFDRYPYRNGEIVCNLDNKTRKDLLDNRGIDMSYTVSEHALDLFCKILAFNINSTISVANRDRIDLLIPSFIV